VDYGTEDGKLKNFQTEIASKNCDRDVI
jgi:hypothetical protein